MRQRDMKVGAFYRFYEHFAAKAEVRFPPCRQYFTGQLIDLRTNGECVFQIEVQRWDTDMNDKNKKAVVRTILKTCRVSAVTARVDTPPGKENMVPLGVKS